MLLEVGRIAKAHGIKGEVLVDLSTDRHERVEAGARLSTDRAEELEVVASTPHHHRWIVAFAGVATRSEAEALHGRVLYAEPIDDPDALFVHELIGCEVVDGDGTVIGTVTAVEANPASDLLVLDGGALVPLRFVIGLEPGRLTVDLPDGLLDL